jgi:hypothetical protein
MSFTKEFIKDKLANDVRWMERALLVLLARQTTDEQNSDRTIHSNSRGFNGVDGHYLTYVAKYIQKGNHLSGKHIIKVAHRLPKYWNQILEEIELNRD